MLKDHAIWTGTPVFILKFSFEFVAFFFCSLCNTILPRFLSVLVGTTFLERIRGKKNEKLKFRI